MTVTYSEAPSFSQGWCVCLDTTRKLVLYKLVDGSYRLNAHLNPFSKAYSFTDLEPEDEVLLSQLLDKIRIPIDQYEEMTLDGTIHALSVSSGNKVIGLEWNSRLPKGCTGVETLIDKMRSLADACKAKRG